MPHPPVAAVIGAGDASAREAERARDVGRRLARAGCVVVTGGLGGVMATASEGAAAEGGVVLGILPGPDRREANPHVTLAVATGLGEARNAVLAHTADAFVAVGGAYGTLSEIAFARNRGKPVVGLDTWEVDPSVVRAADPEDAVAVVLAALPRNPEPR